MRFRADLQRAAKALNGASTNENVFATPDGDTVRTDARLQAYAVVGRRNPAVLDDGAAAGIQHDAVGIGKAAVVVDGHVPDRHIGAVDEVQRPHRRAADMDGADLDLVAALEDDNAGTKFG